LEKENQNSMKRKITTFKVAGFTLLSLIMSITGCSNASDNSDLQAKIDSLQTIVNKFNDEQALTNVRLTRFDSLDFDYYSGQDWPGLAISHDSAITVYYPDGTTTVGLYPQHIDALKPLFVFAPDTKIKVHPVRFGGGDWTAVIGVMEGTFSAPMPVGNGKTIPPTNKKFKVAMSTIGHWRGGKMIAEYLFWDNQSFMKQIGVGS
jgi:hypothetical protein